MHKNNKETIILNILFLIIPVTIKKTNAKAEIIMDVMSIKGFVIKFLQTFIFILMHNFFMQQFYKF